MTDCRPVAAGAFPDHAPTFTGFCCAERFAVDNRANTTPDVQGNDPAMNATENSNSAYKVVGTRPIRHDGLDKVTGRAIYGADIQLSAMVYGAVARSPHAHAVIRKIDTSRAESLPGVLAVATGNDMPAAESKVEESGDISLNYSFPSRNVMAQGKVLYSGHVVAAVAALDRNTALEAASLIDVEYELLEPVMNVHDALAPGAPVVVPDLVGNDVGEPVRDTNVATHLHYELGDPDAGFEQAATIIERSFELATVHQGYIEPQAGTAYWNAEDRLTVWTSTQGAFGARRQLANILRMPESRIKVVPLEIGGGFGGKISVYLEPVAAILSRKCGRPVKMWMDRKSVFEATGPAAGGAVRVKIGVNEKGYITAAEAEFKYEAGAFPGAPIAQAIECGFAPYRVPNARVDGYDLIVNKPKTAAYRAPGTTHAAFAIETVMDELGEKLGIDPIELRRMNASREGDRRVDGPIWGPRFNLEVLEAAKNSPHWTSPLERDETDGKRQGRGLAMGYWRNGGRKSAATLSVNIDGTVALVEGSVDIGGTRVALAMQAAEVLGIPVEDVRPTVADTEGIGFTDITAGSRTAYATGYATYNAAQSVIAELKKRAALVWDIDHEQIGFEDGVFRSNLDSELQMSFKELAARLDTTGGPVITAGSVDLTDASGAFGIHIADVEIDPETGKTDVIRYTVVQDVGRAVHPSYVEGQIQGGASQGVGWALNEEYFMGDDGVMLNASFLDYRMPTSLDLPMIDVILVEKGNPLHPFGVRGVGEVPITPPVAAIANAIHDALGVRMRVTPMNPGRILNALEAKAAGSRSR